MKWYPRDPSAWLAGVIGLDAEERGFYDTVIELWMARDGKNITDNLVCQAMGCRPQTWRKVKSKLIDKGKVRVNPDGTLTANRVETTLQTARKLMAQTSGWRRAQLKKQELNATVNVRKPITIKKDSYNGEIQQEAGEGNVISWEEAEQCRKGK